MGGCLRVSAIVAALLLAPAVACADEVYAASDGDATYWQIADRLHKPLDPMWDGDRGYYGGANAAALNGQVLTTHALAALHGHRGPARNDARARAIARALTASPPFLWWMPLSRRDPLAHAPGWSEDIDATPGPQHPVFDTQVVSGLVAAWRARRELGLDDALVERIEREIVATSTGAFYRWPALRTNQFNWNADLLAAAATVSGDSRALRRDLARYIRGFVAGVRPSPGSVGNLGPGLRFHYNPRTPLNDVHNVDSAEYANIVWTFATRYVQARRAGMTRPSSNELRLLRGWARRVLAGYWTHGGYLNWDTGFGFKRWHQAKKFTLAQSALIGLATARELQPDRRFGRWAKWMLDRSLHLYDRWLEECGGELPPPLAFGVRAEPQRPCDAALAAARAQANAARAADAGLGRIRAERPPALYSFDPDTGRLAVTTPSYNTAIMAVNQRAFPYGGLDLARLYDGEQEVAAGIGGRPPASFGLLVRDAGGHRALATQLGRPRVRRGAAPLRLLRAPRGAGATASSRPGRAFAGPFRRLHAAGSTRSGPLVARVSHRFTPGWIESRWVVRRSGGPRCSADVLFPSWGDGATVSVVLRDGSRLPVNRATRALPPGAWLHIRSERSGYVVVPLAGARSHGVRLLHPRPQSSAPRPGPTAAVRLAPTSRFHRREFAVRIATVPAGASPDAVARALHGG